MKPFKMPSIRQVARNALKAAEAGKLQAVEKCGSGDGCYFTQQFGNKKLVCVIGASLPTKLGVYCDDNAGSMAEMFWQKVATAPKNQWDRYIKLQNFHDRVVGAFGNNEMLENFMNRLKKLAR